MQLDLPVLFSKSLEVTSINISMLLIPSKKGENNKAWKPVFFRYPAFQLAFCILRWNIGWCCKTINMDNMGPMPSGRSANRWQSRSNCYQYVLGDSNNQTLIVNIKEVLLDTSWRRMKRSHQMTKDNCSTLGPDSMAAALGRALRHGYIKQIFIREETQVPETWFRVYLKVQASLMNYDDSAIWIRIKSFGPPSVITFHEVVHLTRLCLNYSCTCCCRCWRWWRQWCKQ